MIFPGFTSSPRIRGGRRLGTSIVVLSALLGLLGCASDDERLADFMERGEAYVEEGQFEEAIIEFKNVLQIDPNHAPAHEALSLAYLQVEKPREAYWEMSETVRLDPENIDARLRYGTISAAVGDHDVAREQAEAILQIDPKRAQAFLLRAQAREAREEYEGAEEDYQAAIGVEPEAPAYAFLYAGFLERRQRIDEAIEALRGVVELEESYLAVSTLARMVSQLGKDPVESEALLRRTIEVALEAPREAPERDPSAEARVSLTENVLYENAVPTAYILLSSFLFDDGRFDEAIAVLEEGVPRAEGRKSDLIYQMARLYRVEGREQEADDLIYRAARESPDDPAPQLVLSAYLGQKGDLDGALAAAQAAVAIDPESRPARLREAELLVDMGYQKNQPESIERGRSIVNSILDEEPSSPEAHFVRAKVELAENDVKAAEQSLMTVLETRPDWPQARFVLGSALAASGEANRARVELARAVELDPAMSEARKLLTQVHAGLGEHEFAIEQGRAYLRQVPGDSQIRIVVAQSLIRVGRTQEAYEEVERIPEDQRDAAAYFALGRLDLAFGRLDLGRERLMKANELQPDNAAVLRALLALDRESGNVEASRQRIAAAAEANPDDSELLELKAEVALIQGDLESAEASLTRAVEVDPRNVSAQLSLAGVAQRLGDVERTIQVVEKASQALPESAELQFRLAVLYENHGDRQQAIGAYERAIALDDGLAQAKNNLAYLLAETPGGDLDRALELAQQAKEQLPDDPNAADTLGWVLLKRGVPSAAIGYLEEAAERFPAEAYEVQGIVQNHLAQAYEQNAEADKAMAASRNVLQSYEQLSAVARQRGIEIPEPEWATEAKARIERLEAAS